MTNIAINDAIEFTVENHIALIRLNRPEAMNTFNADMAAAWTEAYRYCDESDDVRVVVVTGAGKAFCAGADMSNAGSTFDKQDDMDFSTCPIFPAYKLNKPVIAALNGHAIGIGFSLALQCDMRIAANEAKYGLLQVQRGVLADGCSHWLLPKLIGLEKALYLHTTGEKLSGQQLHEIGLALRSVPSDQVLDEAMKIAQSIASQSSPLIAAMAKRLVWQADEMSLDEMETKETKWLHHSMGLPDAIEGGMAFFEKRAANWQASVSQHFPDDA